MAGQQSLGGDMWGPPLLHQRGSPVFNSLPFQVRPLLPRVITCHSSCLHIVFLLPTPPPMVTGIHLLAMWQYIGECHFQGCQGYALHLAAVQASPTSQAPPPMLTSVDELNLKSFPLFYPCKPALNKWSVLFVHSITKAFLTLACPCFPVLEVDISTILHGRPLIRTWPFLRSAEHCWGKVLDAPASAPSKSSCWSAINVNTEKKMGARLKGILCSQSACKLFFWERAIWQSNFTLW